MCLTKLESRGWRMGTGEGKAYFVEQPIKAGLRYLSSVLSMAAINIIELDKKDYAYSMVAGLTDPILGYCREPGTYQNRPGGAN